MGWRKHLGEELCLAKLPCATADCGAEAEAGRRGGIKKGTVAKGLQGRPLRNTALAFLGVGMMGKQRNAKLDELSGPVQHQLRQLFRIINQE